MLASSAAAVAITAGVLLRVHSSSALWLDEAQSVAIARQPLPDLFAALREDGSPPLYYLLLHYWMAAFGSGAGAVRALSVLISVLAIGAMFLAARAVGGRRVGGFAAVLVATSPFAIRYATEARMYALVTLLSAIGVLVVDSAARRPTHARLLAVGVVSGLLALTHYWALFLLAATAALLAVRSVCGPRRRTARRLLVAVIGGAVLFVAWLPSFAYQLRHTGTPWTAPPRWSAAFTAVRSWGGVGRFVDAAEPIYAIVLLLCAVAIFARGGRGTPLTLGRPQDRRSIALLVAGFGSMLLGVAVSRASGSGFEVRYGAAALAPTLVLVGLGAGRLGRTGTGLVTAVAVLGLATSVDAPFTTTRTQAAQTAGVLRGNAAAGDLVVFCPDQLGPAVTRLLPEGIRSVGYPTLEHDARVDWVDYASRNAAAVPAAIAGVVDGQAAGVVWLVRSDGYHTFGTQCAQLDASLSRLRCGRSVVQESDGRFYEHESVIRFGHCAGDSRGR